MQVLQDLFKHRDEELEFQINWEPSFKKYSKIIVMDSISDATTAVFYRKVFKTKVIERLFEMFEATLRS